MGKYILRGSGSKNSRPPFAKANACGRNPCVAGILLGVSLTIACGPASVRPVSYPNPDVSCPGGRLTWRLEVEDQRAVREAETRVVASVREAIQKSFPGCRWSASQDHDAGTIAIEIHRLASALDTGSWEAAAEWTVSARDASGHTLTQFEVNEEVSRPNYQASDNEKESLSEAFRRAVERTARGLSGIPTSGRLRHPEGTVDERVGGLDLARRPVNSVSRQGFRRAGETLRHGPPLEWISQPERTEVL
jgi:hypothetical protein